MRVQHEISQRDLRNRSGEIMDAVEHGETFTVTRSGSPIAQLVPLCRRHAVSRDQFAAVSANAPLIDADRRPAIPMAAEIHGLLDTNILILRRARISKA